METPPTRPGQAVGALLSGGHGPKLADVSPIFKTLELRLQGSGEVVGLRAASCTLAGPLGNRIFRIFIGWMRRTRPIRNLDVLTLMSTRYSC